MKKATQQKTKAHNRRLTLKTIYQHGAMSRAEAARVTHLTRTTISQIVSELMAEGLVDEIGLGVSKGGKPPVLLGIVEDARQIIAIDLANSEFRGGVLDLCGKFHHRINVPVLGSNGAHSLKLVYQIVDELLAAATSPLLGIGIGTPGLVDAQTGTIRRAVNLDWCDLPLSNLLQLHTNLTTYVANDSQVAALGEYTFGHHPQQSNLIVVKAGRGVGAGIVLNGRLHYGDGGGAGEIGHVRVVENGEQCLCGHTGCLETLVNTQALIQQAQQVVAQNPDSILGRLSGEPANITTELIAEALMAGDFDIKKLVADNGRCLGRAVANLVGVLNLQQVIIAGSMARFGDTLRQPLCDEMRRSAMAPLVDETKVGISKLGQDIVMLGAAALILDHELGVV